MVVMIAVDSGTGAVDTDEIRLPVAFPAFGKTMKYRSTRQHAQYHF